ncbi:adenine nucleotide translocase lysine N-methyltransferase isoform X2 [Phacochoerus africanus]|uniref:adenine nucleotide translocase lysine N-methyltransferase isoform X2 n=1 Tax=Phacochoerus africanus TaxID=41426 RepID=UPI001FD94E3C|nr:adenine nucleotide translocase lysine N-methyltransferase isoform X2 [Phacochoerus africanus]
MSLSRRWSLQLLGLFLPSPWLGQLPEGPSHPAPLPSQTVNICLLGSAKYLLLDSHRPRPRRPQRSLRFLLNALSRGRVLVASPATVPGLGWLAGYHPGESFTPWLTAAGGLQPHRTCLHCQAAGSAAPLPSGVSPRWDVRPRGPRRPGQARSNHLRSGPTRLSAADYRQPALPPEPARADPDPRDPRPGTCKTGSRPERSRTRTDPRRRLRRPLPASGHEASPPLPASEPWPVPYVGASARQVEHVLSLLRGRSGKMVDLGSGDGRIVLAAHKCGLRPAVGYELNPWLVRLAWLHAWRAGCVSLRDCYNVSVFLAPSVLPLLEDKLQAELPVGARVVSGRFPLPTWQPVAVVGEGLDRVWAYDVHRGGPAGPAVPGPSSASVPGAPSSQAD